MLKAAIYLAIGYYIGTKYTPAELLAKVRAVAAELKRLFTSSGK